MKTNNTGEIRKGNLIANHSTAAHYAFPQRYDPSKDCSGCTTAMVNRTMIEGVQKRTTILEKKIDWVLYTIITTLIGVVMNLVILIGG